MPDYASTAIMIQGSTLEAGPADCGDLLDHGQLSDLMTRYVILSRVKSAVGLLLLRAFCQNLSQMGAPPGPYCLLKMLRYRFQTDASRGRVDVNAPYGPEEAMAEYRNLMATHETWLSQKKVITARLALRRVWPLFPSGRI